MTSPGQIARARYLDHQLVLVRLVLVELGFDFLRSSCPEFLQRNKPDLFLCMAVLKILT